MIGSVGEDPDDVGAAADLAVEALAGVVAPDLAPDLLGESAERQDVGAGGVQVLGDGWLLHARPGVSGRMKPLQTAIAVGHRAHPLAFALMRSGEPYDPSRLAESVRTGGQRRSIKAGGPVSKNDREAACRQDVTHPPVTTVPAQAASRKTPLRT